MIWKVVPHPKLKRDYIGKTIRTRRPMQNALIEIPTQSIATVESRPNTGARLRFPPCACCGIAAYISRVEDRDFEFVEAASGVPLAKAM